MTAPLFQIVPETPQDADLVEDLHAVAFGPGRFARTAFRLREGAREEPRLSYAAWSGTGASRALAGSIRFTPVMLGAASGLLLGPLVVRPDWKGRGCGLALMKAGIEAARTMRARWIVLVGDEPYYARAGFTRAPAATIRFPGPVDPARILTLELEPGALEAVAGMLAGVPV